MRISRRPTDGCFVSDPRGIRVYLDDDLQRDVVFADDEAGVVILHVIGTDSFGEKTLGGRVRIEGAIAPNRLSR